MVEPYRGVSCQTKAYFILHHPSHTEEKNDNLRAKLQTTWPPINIYLEQREHINNAYSANISTNLKEKRRPLHIQPFPLSPLTF
jgi:hypothetical protein